MGDRHLLRLAAELKACVDSLRRLEPDRAAVAQKAEELLPPWPKQLTYSVLSDDGDVQTARMSAQWIDRHAGSMALQWLSDDGRRWRADKHRQLADYQARREAIWEATGLTAVEATADEIGRRASRLREEIIATPAATVPGLRAKAEAIAMLFGEDRLDLGGTACEMRLAQSIVGDLLLSRA
jgi:hypothetical protein